LALYLTHIQNFYTENGLKLKKKLAPLIEMAKFWKPFSKKLESVEKLSERVKIETEKLGRNCPDCKEGELVIRVGRFGKFISCGRFPDCKYIEKFVEKTGFKCEECSDGELIVKRSKRGKFFGCSNHIIFHPFICCY